ncbi:MAG: hypothetical protein Q8N05_14750 [Bacteroidota bacterium]|nr:hypothetical protein [Bacteroidota bacterium]
MAGRLTIRDFLERAKLVHGDKYDYSKITYLYESDKITIFCKKHQIEFLQSVHKHLAGQGCRKCFSESNGDRCRTSLIEFIKKAKAIHGDKYNYDGVDYKNNNTNIKIHCSINGHGDFFQTPRNHTHKTNPQGCPVCGGKTNWTKEKFINKSREVHNGKYNYDKVKFINTIRKVIITCPEHGDFPQTPNKHLSGQKCPRCVLNFKGTTESFIAKAIEIHGEKYSYDNTKYTSNHGKVFITCPIHGDFEQSPANHTHKTNPQGCPKCSGRYPLNTDEFVLRANEKHDFYYDYSKVVYESMTSKVIIICPFHGEFEQQSSVHLNGSGCQKCRLPKGEQKIQKALKELDLQFEQQYSFPDCRYINPLPFDFLIRIGETQYLIEFNGEQHYRPVKFGGVTDNNADDTFEEIKKRDEVKKDYAIKNGIPLLIIRYDETDRILEFIKEFLNMT